MSERYTLLELQDVDKWKRFIDDPMALLWPKNMAVRSKIVLMILELIYYFKWVQWGSEIEGLTYEYISPSGNIEIVKANTLKIEDIGIIVKKLNEEKISDYKLAPRYMEDIIQDTTHMELSALLTGKVRSQNIFNLDIAIFKLLPEEMQYVFNVDEICRECTVVTTYPGNTSSKYADLYLKFRIWGVKLYDEDGNQLKLDKICKEHIHIFCTDEQLDRTYKSWAYAGLGSEFPAEIREKIVKHVESEGTMQKRRQEIEKREKMREEWKNFLQSIQGNMSDEVIRLMAEVHDPDYDPANYPINDF